jgi:hypothetical protein
MIQSIAYSSVAAIRIAHPILSVTPRLKRNLDAWRGQQLNCPSCSNGGCGQRLPLSTPALSLAEPLGLTAISSASQSPLNAFRHVDVYYALTENQVTAFKSGKEEARYTLS